MRERERLKKKAFNFFFSTRPKRIFWAIATNSFALPFQSTHCPAANLMLAHLPFPCHRGKQEPGWDRAWCPCVRRISSTSISSSTSMSLSSRFQRQRQRRRQQRQPFASSSLASSSVPMLWRIARRHPGAASGAAERTRGLRLGGESAPSFLSCFFFSSSSSAFDVGRKFEKRGSSEARKEDYY